RSDAPTLRRSDAPTGGSMADHATKPHPDDQPVPVVDCALYKHSERRAGTLPLTEAMDTARTSPDSFVWIGLREPTTDQLKVVADAFGLHPLAVEDAVHTHQRPKLERYDDSPVPRPEDRRLRRARPPHAHQRSRLHRGDHDLRRP
ncbi:hypothetical protein O3Q52_37310, partial [Streptomyces sp. ActVer]|nr:hypothetical protein [Streptomyces sp. ActVer]